MVVFAAVAAVVLVVAVAGSGGGDGGRGEGSQSSRVTVVVPVVGGGRWWLRLPKKQGETRTISPRGEYEHAQRVQSLILKTEIQGVYYFYSRLTNLFHYLGIRDVFFLGDVRVTCY